MYVKQSFTHNAFGEIPYICTIFYMELSAFTYTVTSSDDKQMVSSFIFISEKNAWLLESLKGRPKDDEPNRWWEQGSNPGSNASLSLETL